MRAHLVIAAALAGCLLAPHAQAQPSMAHVANIAGSDVRLPLTSLQQMRRAGTLLQQYDFSCGSAALATLLTYHYGHPVSEQNVLEQMYARGEQEKIRREGFSLLDMKHYLDRLGFAADGFEQPLDKLLDARVPAIVLINEAGYHHFVVVKGLTRDRVLIGDPAKGTRALPRAQFESLWIGKLLFVIHNRMEQARFNRPADWRAAPAAPLRAGVGHEAQAGVGLPKFGPGDF